MEYDLRSSTAEVLASARRRPPETPLDAEPSLRNLRIVSLDRESRLSLKFPGRSYLRGADGKWETVMRTFARPSLAELAKSLETGWRDGDHMALSQLSAKLSNFQKPSPSGRPGTGGERNAPARIVSATSRDGEVWFLESDPRQDRLKLGRFKIDGKMSLLRDLDFSPEHLAEAELGGFSGSASVNSLLIPLDSWVAIYEPESPVLWFLSAEQISALSQP